MNFHRLQENTRGDRGGAITIRPNTANPRNRVRLCATSPGDSHHDHRCKGPGRPVDNAPP